MFFDFFTATMGIVVGLIALPIAISVVAAGIVGIVVAARNVFKQGSNIVEFIKSKVRR